jgi:hypothetical protein
MKAMIYSASWCATCQSMADYLKQQYPNVSVQFVPLDRLPADARDKAFAALRKLTWSDQIPVTLIDDTVILGADYKALAAILGPTGAPPPSGNSQHRHGWTESTEPA